MSISDFVTQNMRRRGYEDNSILHIGVSFDELGFSYEHLYKHFYENLYEYKHFFIFKMNAYIDT